MKNRCLSVFALVLFFTTACETPTEKREVIVAKSPAPKVQEYLMASTLFVQHSAEYQALCLQAYNVASDRLLKAVSDGAKKPAVVLDIDETILDNSAYSAWQVATDNPYSTETWALWTDLAAAPEVPGATAFLNLADSLGVALFYVSNRDTSALLPTIKNMADLGMPQLTQSQFYLKTTTSGKAERRKAIEEQGYNVVLFVGDNLGDFHESWDKESVAKRAELTVADQQEFGTKYIVLPNPIYGTWEGALYDFDRSWSDAQRDSLRRSWLNPAAIQ